MDYVRLKKLRIFIKVQYKSDFMELVQIWRPFWSGFDPDLHWKVVWIWFYFDKSWSYLTFGSTANGLIFK